MWDTFTINKYQHSAEAAQSGSRSPGTEEEESESESGIGLRSLLSSVYIVHKITTTGLLLHSDYYQAALKIIKEDESRVTAGSAVISSHFLPFSLIYLFNIIYYVEL